MRVSSDWIVCSSSSWLHQYSSMGPTSEYLDELKPYSMSLYRATYAPTIATTQKPPPPVRVAPGPVSLEELELFPTAAAGNRSFSWVLFGQGRLVNLE